MRRGDLGETKTAAYLNTWIREYRGEGAKLLIDNYLNIFGYKSNIKNKLISKLQSLQILVSIATIYKVDPNLGNDIITNDYRRMIAVKSLTSDSIKRGYAFATAGSFGNSKINGTITDELQIAFYQQSGEMLDTSRLRIYGFTKDFKNYQEMTTAIEGYLSPDQTLKKIQDIAAQFPKIAKFFEEKDPNGNPSSQQYQVG